MSMSVGSVNNVYATYSAQKTRQNLQSSKREVTQEDYIKELQEKNPQINIAAGNPDRTAGASNYTGRTDVRIDPELLKRMKDNPQIAAKYENMLSKIPALDRWADSMIKSITGSEVKYRQVWIDKDGNMGSMCITGPSEEQKKNEDKKIEEKKEYEKILTERRKQNEEKRQVSLEEKEKLQEKLSEAGRKQFGNRWKGVIIIDKDDKNAFVPEIDKDHAAVSGLHMDFKA